MKCCIFVALIASMSVQGVANLKHQRNIIGEFSNPNLEELITWINESLREGMEIFSSQFSVSICLL